MVKKKSCEKHYRYVASCPDCRALNEEGEDSSRTNRLYPDSNISNQNSNNNTDRGSPEIPNLHDTESPSSNDGDRDGDGNGSRRFRYNRSISPDKRKKLVIGGIFFLIVLLIIGIYAIPLWHARISLQNQLYDKFDIDYWKLYTQSYWSTNFFFNKIGLIGAIIGSLIMTIPPEESVFLLLVKRFGWSRPSKKKVILIWWTAGFVLFFLIGQVIENGYFALTMYMIQNGDIDISFGTFFGALSALSNPSKLNPVELFVYANVTRPILMYTLFLIIIRLIFNGIFRYSVERNEFKVGSIGSYVISIFFLMGLLARPLKAQNGINLIRVWSLYLGFFAFLIIGIGLFVYQRKMAERGIIAFPRTIRKTTVISAIALIVIIIIPVFISIPKSVRLNNQSVWQEVIWDVKYEKQIDWTRSAAGIQMGDSQIFKTFDIDEYPDNMMSSDTSILNVIRQYDKEFTGKKMSKRITSSREEMADSDIIYVSEGIGQGEYWVAPKTLPVSLITKNTVNQHTEILDHVEGFIAIDTSTGEIVSPEDIPDIFGVSSQYPIFFGEQADNSYTETETGLEAMSFTSIKAYQNDILLNTKWNENNTIKYEGEPDGSLKGLEAFWFTVNMGLTSYALNFSFPKEFLINRNIRDRLDAILLPGSQIDYDPYLVFNAAESRMYYALSVYTDLYIGSYAQSRLLRFLGTVLIDVKTGDLDWYRNPSSLFTAEDDMFDDLWDIYVNPDIYPWEEVPDWLLPQIRYPEELWEKQLQMDYRYHVTDPITWFQESDFYKRPESADVYYIETDLGEGIEFVGTDMVEYDATGAEKLAGLYMIRHGEHFGETYFYRTDRAEDNLIGPATAEEQLETSASQSLKAINTRFGNKLLYPLAGSLYYYLPVYSQTEGENFEEFILAGLVNAFDQSAFWGDNLDLAYGDLYATLEGNQTQTDQNETSPLSLEVDAPNQIEYDPVNWAEFEILISYLTTNDTLPNRNVSLNLTIWSDKAVIPRLFNQNLTGYDIDEYTKNYTIVEWTGINALRPSEKRGFTLKMNLNSTLGGSSLGIFYQFDLYDLDNQERITTGRQIFTFTN